MRRILAGAAMALVVAAGAPAAAREPSIWAQCDGQAKPESAGVTAARIATVALGSGFLIGLLALPESPTGADLAVGQAGVDACTAALADPIIEDFWPRKINVLRARALDYVQINRFDLALADLRAARAVGDGQPAQVLFDRSVGVSVLLFEAALLAREGQGEEARALAVRAAEARPYASAIQRASLLFFIDTPTLGADESRILDRIERIGGRPTLTRALRLNATSDVAGAADAWEAALGAGVSTSYIDVSGLRRIPVFDQVDPMVLARTAAAVARAGRYDRAAALRAQLATIVADAPAQDAALPPPPTAQIVTRADLLDARIEQMKASVTARNKRDAAAFLPLIDAQIAAGRGDFAGAVASAQRAFARLPMEPATADLLDALSKAPESAPQMPAALVASIRGETTPSLARAWRERDLLAFARGLPQYQRVDGMNRYRSQGPPGFRGGVGYLDAATDGGVDVSYGAAPGLEAQEEMLLLRAAEVAAGKNREAFVVTANEFGRMSVVFADAGAPAALRVADVMAALKPVYIDIPEQIEAARGAHRRERRR